MNGQIIKGILKVESLYSKVIHPRFVVKYKLIFFLCYQSTQNLYSITIKATCFG
jgi:hypothetical protein